MKTVLVATPVKNASKWIGRYLSQIKQFNCRNCKVHFAFLEGNSSDDTYDKLLKFSESRRDVWLQKRNVKTKKRFRRLAFLRNYIVDNALKREDYVLWIDSDIIKTPPNLLNVLIQDNYDIVAPIVLIEHKMQFYDTHAFRYKGKNFRHLRPYCEAPELKKKVPFQVSSVGTCYLVNRKIYEANTRYGDKGSEQISFCKESRKKGFRIWVDPRIKVYHANLPMYGAHWH